ncbi:MAG: PspC domain-containing protein [Chloroflexi bacterium]|nr:PspC domain-containing protein [Chloroflexota bacterium]
MSKQRLMRSTDDRMFAGVCGGLAQYFGVSTTIIRALFVLFGLAGGSALFVYLILWLIMPEV